jgi:hypothetical protein
MNKNKVGLTLGYFLSLGHLIWALLIWLMPTQLQKCLDWMFELHGLTPIWILTSMTLINAIILVIVTFIAGYMLGWVYVWLAECAECKKKK